MINIIVVGDAVVDTHVQIDEASLECNLDGKNCKLCLDFASKIPITDSFQAIGGDGANIAAGAAKLGLNTAVITTVGNDSNGTLIKHELAKQKINTDYITADKSAKTRYSVILNYKSERTILSFHQKRKYAWPKTMPAVDWLYYTGLSAGFETLQDKMIAFIAKHPTVRLAFTPGSYQLKNAFDKVREVLPHADILIVNLEEAEKISDTTLKKEKSVAAIIHKLLSLGAKEAVITDGIRGAWAGGTDTMRYMPTFPVEVLSKTGAGDAFASAYVSARFYCHGIETALAWGTANSCGVIGQHGAQMGLLDRSGIEAMIKKYKDIKIKAT